MCIYIYIIIIIIYRYVCIYTPFYTMEYDSISWDLIGVLMWKSSKEGAESAT